MKEINLLRLLGILPLCIIFGCSGPERNWKETVPVTGQISVSGKPAKGVMIKFHPQNGMDEVQPSVTQALTDEDGKFEATTYKLDDGAPVGDYKLTFTWPEINEVTMEVKGDRFEGRFEKPENSKYSISVQSGEPIDMGEIDLK